MKKVKYDPTVYKVIKYLCDTYGFNYEKTMFTFSKNKVLITFFKENEND